MVSVGYLTLILFAQLSSTVLSERQLFKDALELPINGGPKINGTRWAVLVAGSDGWSNYRHQADLCHAYQILKKGGLKDENIVVFMKDDIAFNVKNPRRGIIINEPNGDNVYDGVPKDYTGENCTLENFFAAVLGNKSALTGGSGKVVNSGPDDHIFIYFVDHGGPGLVMMPSDLLFATDLIQMLKTKHAAKSYRKMVFYLEACDAGSMFDGILPNNLSIYAVTASNPSESSYAYYCPTLVPSPPKGYSTCLGDLFSISWMEDSDFHDSDKETLRKQYQVVRNRTLNGNYKDMTSHVMRYGDLEIGKDLRALFMGRNPASEDSTLSQYRNQAPTTNQINPGNVVHQRDAELLHLTYKFNEAQEGSMEKKEAQEKLRNVIAQRSHVDTAVKQIAKTMFGESRLDSILNSVRPQGHPLVDDWDCLKSMVRVYEENCGSLGRYGMKYTRAMANMCNAGANVEEMAEAADAVCSKLTPK